MREKERQRQTDRKTERNRNINQKFRCNFLDIKMPNLVYSKNHGAQDRWKDKDKTEGTCCCIHIALPTWLFTWQVPAIWHYHLLRYTVLCHLCGHTRLSTSHSSKGYTRQIPGIYSFCSVLSALIPIDYEQQCSDSLLTTT